MRLLVFSDLQATDGGEVCFHDPGVKLQDWRVQKFLRLLRSVYKEKKCDGLIDLGDTTDDRSAIPVPTINTLYQHLTRFPENGFNLKLIGNHEQYTRNATVDVGALFRPFFDVFSRPAIVEHDDCDFVLAPYPGSHEELEKWLFDTRSGQNKPRVLLGHFQAVGSTTRGGTLMDGISRDVLAQFDLVLLGHIHKPQQFMPNAYYVGSPFQQNWGESGEQKRVGILDTSTLKMEWVPMDGFPVYRTVSLAEFLKIADDRSEDRFEVILTTSDEAAELYNHPLAARTRPRYDFKAPAEDASGATKADWDTKSIMQRYLEKNPWEIELTRDEMLSTGLDMIQHGS